MGYILLLTGQQTLLNQFVDYLCGRNQEPPCKELFTMMERRAEKTVEESNDSMLGENEEDLGRAKEVLYKQYYKISLCAPKILLQNEQYPVQECLMEDNLLSTIQQNKKLTESRLGVIK